MEKPFKETRRRLLLGVGVNDAPFPVKPVIDGKQRVYPLFRVWRDMLRRAYCPKIKAKWSTYENVTVCDEWLYFMTFHEWAMAQPWEGNQLDKDILQPGNKHYSPQTCVFVPREINNLLVARTGASGLPRGVRKVKQAKTRPYAAQGSDGKGRVVGLGYFSTAEEAHAAYLSHKASRILEVADTQPEPIKSGLLRHAALLV